MDLGARKWRQDGRSLPFARSHSPRARAHDYEAVEKMDANDLRATLSQGRARRSTHWRPPWCRHVKPTFLRGKHGQSSGVCFERGFIPRSGAIRVASPEAGRPDNRQTMQHLSEYRTKSACGLPRLLNVCLRKFQLFILTPCRAAAMDFLPPTAGRSAIERPHCGCVEAPVHCFISRT